MRDADETNEIVPPEPRFEYEPSPAHKIQTTEAGPPRWIPFKEKCPPEMTVREREELLAQSISEDGRRETPRRYAFRHTPNGPEFYECKLTREKSDGTIVVHGHPTSRVPPRVLRRMRDMGLITQAEYRFLVKELS
jgi:hypothetical protein